MSGTRNDTLKKYTKIFSVFVVIISAAVGFIRFFSVSELPVISGDFDLENFTNQGRQLNFVDEVSKNEGKIVYFDKVMLSTEWSNPRYEEELYKKDGAVSYSFNFNELSSPKVKHKSDISEKDFVSDLLSYYAILEESRSAIEMMNMLNMSGYNARIIVHSKTNDRSEYSEFHPLAVEGTVDFIDGPFQIKNVSGAEAVVYELTAPILDSEQKKQVECTKKKEWSALMKKVFCQFI